MCARRFHRKSKSGCTNCRQRRIKCDEAQGGCDNCRKRNYTCSLRMPGAIAGHAGHVQILRSQLASIPPTPTEPHFTNALMQQGILGRLPRSVRPHAGALFQHFASETVATMGFGMMPQQAWCTAIPDLALKHDFVVHGALAIAALHISTSSESADAKERYENIAALELNMGLASYMAEIRSISSDNVEALFTFSTAISLWSTFQARNDCRSLVASGPITHVQAENIASEAVQVICRCLRTLRGVQVILVPGWSKLENGPLRYVVQRESWSNAIPVADAHLAEERQLKNLETMWSNPHRAYEDHFDILRQAWLDLHQSFKIVWSLVDDIPLNYSSRGPSFDWTSVFHFAVQCSLRFVSLLEQQCIEAWVLMAHYAILHAEVGKGLWWLDDSAVNLVAAAALVIGTNNWDWITWPAARVSFDLESLRPLALDRPKICLSDQVPMGAARSI
ncbi:sterol uptake control protein 2 [Stagonosporopsis vannaccii]|nr:sterol uptake control protein 2 [Stagonosporopsis vannaccii]